MGCPGAKMRACGERGPAVIHAHRVAQWLDKSTWCTTGSIARLWFPPEDERFNSDPVFWTETTYEGSRHEIQTVAEESYERDQSHDAVDGQQENIEDSSTPRKGHQTPPDPVNPAVDAQARKDFPALLKRSYRPARS
jgi:hypothetical protein